MTGQPESRELLDNLLSVLSQPAGNWDTAAGESSDPEAFRSLIEAIRSRNEVIPRNELPIVADFDAERVSVRFSPDRNGRRDNGSFEVPFRARYADAAATRRDALELLGIAAAVDRVTGGTAQRSGTQWQGSLAAKLAACSYAASRSEAQAACDDCSRAASLKDGKL